MKTLNIGFNNFVIDEHVISIIVPDTAPARRLREDAKNKALEMVEKMNKDFCGKHEFDVQLDISKDALDHIQSTSELN